MRPPSTSLFLRSFLLPPCFVTLRLCLLSELLLRFAIFFLECFFLRPFVDLPSRDESDSLESEPDEDDSELDESELQADLERLDFRLRVGVLADSIREGSAGVLSLLGRCLGATNEEGWWACDSFLDKPFRASAFSRRIRAGRLSLHTMSGGKGRVNRNLKYFRNNRL